MLVGDKTLANNQIQLIHFISFIKLDLMENIVMDSMSSSSIAVILKLFPH